MENKMAQYKDHKKIGVGIVGLGTVGSGVVRILRESAKELRQRAGVELEVRRICVKSLSKPRAVSVPKSLLCTDPSKILNDASISIVVEVAGGIHPAKEIIQKALSNGKHVVTANKALLAQESDAVWAAAARSATEIGFEASVCGGIPIIRSLKDGLVSNEISHFFGIVNGTCNYILSSMSSEGAEFASALKAAQQKGYAEKDPTLDINGTDSAHKLAVLARLAFGAKIPFKKIHIEGIQKISAADIEYARELGYAIKLLAIGKRSKSGLELRVHPTMLPLNHPLAHVNNVYNAVFVHGNQVDDLLFYGKGAGMLPTASAVVSDIVDIAKKIRARGCSMAHPMPAAPARICPIEDIVSKYYLRFQVADKPGVLGRIAQTLGKNRISILSVHQKESHASKSVPVVILTYEARERDLRKALKQINEETAVIRVEK
jgi:homoserine dehydrogenase